MSPHAIYEVDEAPTPFTPHGSHHTVDPFQFNPLVHDDVLRCVGHAFPFVMLHR